MYYIAIPFLGIFPKDSIPYHGDSFRHIFTILLKIGKKNQVTSFVLLKMNRKWRYNRYAQWNIINCKKWNYKIFMIIHKTDNIIISEITQVLKDKGWIFFHMHTVFSICLYVYLYESKMEKWDYKGTHERRKECLKGKGLCASEFSFNWTQTWIIWEDGNSTEKTLPTGWPVGMLVSYTPPWFLPPGYCPNFLSWWIMIGICKMKETFSFSSCFWYFITGIETLHKKKKWFQVIE